MRAALLSRRGRSEARGFPCEAGPRGRGQTQARAVLCSHAAYPEAGQDSDILTDHYTHMHIVRMSESCPGLEGVCAEV